MLKMRKLHVLNFILAYGCDKEELDINSNESIKSVVQVYANHIPIILIVMTHNFATILENYR